MPKKVRLRKILAAVLAVIMVVSAVPFVGLSAFAADDEGTFEIKADKEEIYAGDTVTFTIYMNGVATNGMEFDLEFDTSLLTYDSAEITALNSEKDQTDITLSDDGKLCFTAYDTNNAINEGETTSTAVATATFTVYAQSDFELKISNPTGDKYTYIDADDKISTVSYAKTYTQKFSMAKTDGAIRIVADKSSLDMGEKTTLSIYLDCAQAPINKAEFTLELNDMVYIDNELDIQWNKSLSFLSGENADYSFYGTGKENSLEFCINNPSDVLDKDNILIAKIIITRSYGYFPGDPDQTASSLVRVSQSSGDNSFVLNGSDGIIARHYSLAEYWFDMTDGAIDCSSYYVKSSYNKDEGMLLSVGDSFTLDFYVDAALYPSNYIEVNVDFNNVCLEISDIKWNVPAKQRTMSFEPSYITDHAMAKITLKDDENFVADKDEVCLFTLTVTAVKIDESDIYQMNLWEYGLNIVTADFEAALYDTINNKYVYYQPGDGLYENIMIKKPAPKPTVYSVFAQNDNVAADDEIKTVVSFDAAQAGTYSFDICYDSEKLAFAEPVTAAQDGVTVSSAVNSTDNAYGDGYSYVTVTVDTGEITSGALVNAYFTAVKAGDAKIIVYPKNSTGVTSSASTIVTVDGGTVWGDVNGDGVLNSDDLSAIRAYIIDVGTLADEKIADVNLDGKVTFVDYLLLTDRVDGGTKPMPCEFGYNENSEIPDELFSLDSLTGKIYKNSVEVTTADELNPSKNDEIMVSMNCGDIEQMSKLSCWGFYVEYNPEILTVADVDSANGCVLDYFYIVKEGLVYVFGTPSETSDESWNGNLFGLKFVVDGNVSSAAQLNFACYVDTSETVYKDTALSVYKYSNSQDSVSVIDGYFGSTCVARRWQQTTAESADVKSVAINDGRTTVNAVVGTPLYLAVNREPVNSAAVDVVWSSSNPAVAVVKNGVVTCLSGGIAKITAVCTSTLSGEKFIVSVTVNVKNPVTEKNIFVNTVDNVAADIAKSNLVQTGADTYSLTFKRDFIGSVDLASMFTSTGDGFYAKISAESIGSVKLNSLNELVCTGDHSTATKLKVELYGYDIESDSVKLIATKYVDVLCQTSGESYEKFFAVVADGDDSIKLGEKLYLSDIDVYQESVSKGTTDLISDWSVGGYSKDIVYNLEEEYFEFPKEGKFYIYIFFIYDSYQLNVVVPVNVYASTSEEFEILNGVLRSSSFKGVDDAVINIPDGTKEIKASFFEELGKNVTLNIPASVEKIDFVGSDVLRGMSSSQLKFADDANFVVIDGVVYDENITVAYLALSDCTEFVAWKSLREIGEKAFENSNVEIVDLSEAISLKKIGSAAFASCVWLNGKDVEVTLYDGVRDIALDAFSGAKSVTVSCYINSYAYGYANLLGYDITLKNIVLGNVTGTENEPTDDDKMLMFWAVAGSVEDDSTLFASEEAADINGDGQFSLVDLLALLLANK